MSFYTEEKERSHRFVLALRMGLPIFLLSIVSLVILFLELQATFFSLIFLIFILFATSVYFLFFLINQSAYEAITDPVTHTFSNEYFSKLYYRWSRNNILTVLMISVDNLTNINEKYGVKNGDKVLNEILLQINMFFSTKGIKKLPTCRHKGGNIVILIEGEKEKNISLSELFLIKHQSSTFSEIEIYLSCVILDTKNIKEYDEIITQLYELQYANKDKEISVKTNEIDPESFERFVLDALKYHYYSVALQEVHCDNTQMFEITLKLTNKIGEILHQSRFVPLLNRLGKIREYEEYFLETAIKLAAINDKNYIITVSPATLRNGLFFTYALELLQKYPQAKEKITLLFEEKEYTPQIKRFREQIAQYKAVGYKIGLDKYGGNHISMLYLKEFSVDIVRFDSLYTRHLHDEKYQNILQGLGIAAHLCGAKTWMSMIENEDNYQVAKRLKINCCQGNHLGKITLINTNQGENK